MKVIAKANDSTYICEVSHHEIAKYMNQYYGDIKRLNVGEDVDLGKGFDFSVKIESACKSMVEASKQFESAQKTMTAYALAIAKGTGGTE
jgi:hypothetical protein